MAASTQGKGRSTASSQRQLLRVHKLHVMHQHLLSTLDLPPHLHQAALLAAHHLPEDQHLTKDQKVQEQLDSLDRQEEQEQLDFQHQQEEQEQLDSQDQQKVQEQQDSQDQQEEQEQQDRQTQVRQDQLEGPQEPQELLLDPPQQNRQTPWHLRQPHRLRQRMQPQLTRRQLKKTKKQLQTQAPPWTVLTLTPWQRGEGGAKQVQHTPSQRIALESHQACNQSRTYLRVIRQKLWQ